MASIIDTVREAESRAALIRGDAEKKAKEDVKRAGEMAALLEEKAKAAAHEAGVEAAAEGAKEGAALSASLTEEGVLASRRECAAADGRMAEAVKYIVDQVIG